MREDTNADFTGRSRKRKADVAVFLQDPDEEIAKADVTKKRQFGNQPWNNGDAIYGNPCALIPTPDKEDDPASPSSPYGLRRFNLTRTSPLPLLGWANRDEVWKIMLNKEQTYLRDKHFLQRHPLLQPKMRAILLDWLMEVCEVYKLHRETFYLAQDFFDRFMATQQNIVKTLLQLIGISSLFIAAKLEEIYPPKLHQFAYVTDGACTEDEILSMELIIMKLLDLCVLDVGCLEFPYGVLAASALYHFSSSELMRKVSGYEWRDVEECVKWMVPFAVAIREAGSSKLKRFRGVPTEDLHNIQTHVNSLDLLDRAQAKQAILAEHNRTSPLPTGVLTPPQSSKKQTTERKAV
uniref:G1/S-specific cyclin-E1 n=1 Tax=Ornithorhynchus anatinus TaxID=9258 RepID=A0A6I8NW19_ORNAN